MKAKIFKHTLKTYFTVKIYRKVVKIAVVAKDSRKPLSPVVNILYYSGAFVKIKKLALPY